jgi:hypothetical protein
MIFFLNWINNYCFMPQIEPNNERVRRNIDIYEKKLETMKSDDETFKNERPRIDPIKYKYEELCRGDKVIKDHMIYRTFT